MQKQFKVLPHYFQFIGVGIMFLGVILVIKVTLGQSNIIPLNIALGIILFGFILFAFAKGKIEEEKIMKKKLQPGFPNYFRKIGIGTILFGIIVLIPLTIWLKKSNPEAFENYKHLPKIIITDFIYIGFILYHGAKEKVEDELITKIRLTSLAITFYLAVMMVILHPVIQYILHNQIEEYKDDILFYMLFMYTIIFHFSKKNR